MRSTRPISTFIVLLLMGCVDPANIDIPSFQYQLVVDGYITTDPGPYEVKLYRSRPLGSADLDRLIPERFSKVRIKDDQGNSELLTEVEEGVYRTSTNGIQGVTGRKYHIEITTVAGKQYESVPDAIMPVGQVTAISFEFVEGNGDEFREGDGFRIFADANGVPGLDDRIRLRMVATYKTETFPERKTKVIPGPEGEGIRVPDPFSCSGYVNQDNKLVKINECTCCVCWANEYDKKPIVVDEEFIANDVFSDVDLGFIPATNMTLYDKIHVEIQELSLTAETFLFWKLVKAQKEGVSNIFQPPSANIKGNIKAVNSEEEVLGIFWAADIHRKSIYINQSDVPYIIEPIDTLIAPCLFIPNSSNQKPSFWQ